MILMYYYRGTENKMNSEIIVGFLKDRNDLGLQFDSSTISSLCRNINRDLPILIVNVHGARETIDVGLSITGEEGLSPYEPYKRAGFSLFRPSGTTESDRIKKSIQQAFDKGYASVVLLSHSVPNLPLSYIEEALSRLREDGGMVLGPLKNGGFYLIGVTRSAFKSGCFGEILPGLCFCDGSGKEEILVRVGSKGIRLFLLPEWYLVRTPEDLKRLCEEQGNGPEWNARWTRHTSYDLL